MAKAKFTQQQLEDAWGQMQADHAQDANNAQAAAQWVQQQLGFGHCKYVAPYGYGHFGTGHGPQPVQYVLALVHETYGPYLADYTTALGNVAWAAVGQPVVGHPQNNPFYTVTTPQGVYTLTFEYFDNHCTGY